MILLMLYSIDVLLSSRASSPSPALSNPSWKSSTVIIFSPSGWWSALGDPIRYSLDAAPNAAGVRPNIVRLSANSFRVLICGGKWSTLRKETRPPL